MEQLKYQPSESFIRVATACPTVSVGDVYTNVARATELIQEATAQQTSILTFPECSITGYTIGDLVNQNSLLQQARVGLTELANETTSSNTAVVVGLPLQVGNALYNCAALLADGEIKGIIPKKNIPNYAEFYEKRWYQSWEQANTTVTIGGQPVPFGNDILFEVGGVAVGIEICEDAWTSSPPSQEKAEHGAVIIVNPSASTEQIGKDDYRRNLVSMLSGSQIGAYVYAGCDSSESTIDIVMGGHQMIAANGQIIAEREPFSTGRLLTQDIDIEHLEHDRRVRGFANKIGMLMVTTRVERLQTDLLAHIEKNPFLPDESADNCNKRLRRAIQIQAQGLAERLRSTQQERVVLGLSGGLDSTLALLVAYEAAKVLGRKPADMIRTVTMPGPASSETTQDNAQELASMLNIPNEVISIKQQVAVELESLSHDGMIQDITYENVQARARTSLLFNYSNKEHCIVLGTGDLTEIHLGWSTYNGDHMSHYNVNASVPKTLVRAEVAYLAEQYSYRFARDILYAIIDQTISPELTTSGAGELSQSSEDVLGPFEVQDHFIPAVVRYGDSKAKIAYLAKHAFKGTYTGEQIDNWLDINITRFVRNQFKRSVMPDGPKVGSVAESPRGDLRMPSDLPNTALWD